MNKDTFIETRVITFGKQWDDDDMYWWGVRKLSREDFIKARIAEIEEAGLTDIKSFVAWVLQNKSEYKIKKNDTLGEVVIETAIAEWVWDYDV